MSKKFAPAISPSQLANDNGPLSSGQVKALKIAIAIMSFLIIAALFAIVGRVIYLASTKPAAVEGATPAVSKLAPKTSLSLPPGAVIKHMSLNGNRLLVHYQSPVGQAAAVMDLTDGATLSRIAFPSAVQAEVEAEATKETTPAQPARQ